MGRKNAREKLLKEIWRLAFGKTNDAARLAFLGGDTEDIAKLDLSALSGIHRMANGAVEVKMIDRVKLIELLLAAEEQSGESDTLGFIRALDAAADRLDGAGKDEL